MKIRTGFVSNSSSSSFCILGVEIDYETYEKLDESYKELKGTRVETHNSPGGGDEKYVGISATAMGDDETPRMIKEELVNTLEKVGVKIEFKDVDWIEDCGYNG